MSNWDQRDSNPHQQASRSNVRATALPARGCQGLSLIIYNKNPCERAFAKKQKTSARIERGLCRMKGDEFHIITTVPPRFQWKYFQLLESNTLKILKTWNRHFQFVCVSNIIFNENISNQTSPNIFSGLSFTFIENENENDQTKHHLSCPKKWGLLDYWHGWLNGDDYSQGRTCTI